MSLEELRIGEFRSFGHGVEVATVVGRGVERACSMLAVRPPCRDANEIAELSEDDYDEALLMAVAVSGAGRVGMSVGEIDKSVELVVFSKTGALAVRGSAGSEPDLDRALSDITAYDNGNELVAIQAQPIRAS